MMGFFSGLQEAMLNLLSAKLRSFLAILGVLVGTASVVALISSSQLATEHALAEFKKLGTNLISLYIEQADFRDSQSAVHFHLSDVPILKSASKQIELIAPYTQSYQSSYFENDNLDAQLVGVTESFKSIAKIQMKKGRFISYLDGRSFYCVIGAKVADKIKNKYPSERLIGNQVRIGPFMFTIVGVLKTWPENLFISANLNEAILIPVQTSYFLSKNIQINNILMRLVKEPEITPLKNQVRDTMQSVLPGQKIIFNSPSQIISIISKQKKTYTWLMAAIGSISLVVGGIGVMNIMLVSVVERKREIGIRMAIGARQIDILRMFLIESVLLTVFGGFLGVIVGVFVSYILVVFTHWAFHLYLTPILLGFFVSVMVGIFSGFYPAFRASKLNPIDCLAGA